VEEAMIVYKITNTITGMSYVGQTVQTLRERWVEHASHAKTGATQSYIARAIRKYGPEAFVIEVLNVCLSHGSLDSVEKFYIKYFNTKVPNGYNLADGGGGVSGWSNGKGYVPTEETRKKLSESGKGNTNALGKKYSEEFCSKVSAALKRRVRNKKSYEKMVETRRSHKRPLTDKQIAANTARRGIPWTEARRAAQQKV
jgi:group I intron endonuclease